jgi:hypothetical protein
MSRWEGDAAGRLERAALELFDELIKMDAIYASFVTGLRDRGADETTARLATDLAVSIWRLAAKRSLHSEEPNFSAELLHATRQLRRVAAGGQAGTDDVPVGAAAEGQE